MKWKKTVPVKIEPHDVEAHAECDLCGGPLRFNAGHWSEVTIEAKIGSTWPEGDFRSVDEFNCCPDCWEKTVRPALIALGLKLYKYEIEEGRIESMPSYEKKT